jgi:hypothetical protein
MAAGRVLRVEGIVAKLRRRYDCLLGAWQEERIGWCCHLSYGTWLRGRIFRRTDARELAAA